MGGGSLPLGVDTEGTVGSRSRSAVRCAGDWDGREEREEAGEEAGCRVPGQQERPAGARGASEEEGRELSSHTAGGRRRTEAPDRYEIDSVLSRPAGCESLAATAYIAHVPIERVPPRDPSKGGGLEPSARTKPLPVSQLGESGCFRCEASPRRGFSPRLRTENEKGEPPILRLKLGVRR